MAAVATMTRPGTCQTQPEKSSRKHQILTQKIVLKIMNYLNLAQMAIQLPYQMLQMPNQILQMPYQILQLPNQIMMDLKVHLIAYQPT